MSDELNASASTDALATDSGSSDLSQPLRDYFRAQESGQVDNSTTATGDEASGVVVAATDAPTTATESSDQANQDQAEATGDEPEATAGSEEQPAAKEAETSGDNEAETTDPEPGEEAADFDALDRATEFLTDPKDLKAKFARNVSNDAIAELARYGEAAKRGQQIEEDLGGKDFIPGLTVISKALQTDDPRNLFLGIEQTASAETLAKVLIDAVNLAFCEADTFEANPQSAPFGQMLKGLVDLSMQDRFGVGITAEVMQQLAGWHQTGWFDKIKGWTESEFVDPEEVQELVDTSKNPALLAIKQENAELKRQLGQKETKTDAAQGQQLAEVENSFGKLTSEEIGKTLTDVVWKNSVLRDIAADSDEIKQEKAFLRRQLTESAVEHFRSSDDSRKLLEAYRTGKGKTAVFTSELAKALNQAVLSTRPETAVAEGMLAKLYRQHPDNRLATQKPAAQAATAANGSTNGQQVKQPTQTKDFAQGQVLTREEIQKNLTERIAGLG